MNVFARGIARSCIDELVREARGVTPFYCSHGEQPRKQSAKLYAMSWAGGEPTSMEPLSKEGDKRLILSSVLRIWDRVDHILEQEELVAEIVHESGILKGRKPWTRESNPDFEAVTEAFETVKEQIEHPIDPEEAVAAAFEEH